MSASINSPSDFGHTNHYYSSSIDSTPGAPNGGGAAPTSNPSIQPPASKYRIVNQEEVASPTEATPTESTPTKQDSLSRRGAYGRRGTGGLSRQSLVSSKHDSAEVEPESKGVQLEDKPMDFD